MQQKSTKDNNATKSNNATKGNNAAKGNNATIFTKTQWNYFHMTELS